MQSDIIEDTLGEHALAELVDEFSPAATPGQRLTHTRDFCETIAALAWTAPQITPPATLRSRLLAQAAHQTAPSVPRTVKAPRLPALLTVRADAGEWEEIASDISIKQLFVDEKSGITTSLYRFAPGATLEPHLHHGHEQCYVLEGDFFTGGHELVAGDFQCAPAGSVHQISYTVNGALVLIVAPSEYEPVAC